MVEAWGAGAEFGALRGGGAEGRYPHRRPAEGRAWMTAGREGAVQAGGQSPALLCLASSQLPAAP